MIDELQQLNNTLYEIYTGIANAVYPELGEGKKPSDPTVRLEGVVPLQERLKKTTEILSGILTGIYNEDELQSKLGGMDIDDLKSVEDALGKLSENASILKTHISRSSNYGAEGEFSAINPMIEIERAIKSLVLSFVYNDIKSEIRVSESKRQRYPEYIQQQFWEDLQDAYTKFAGDFTKSINEVDPNSSDNHDYTKLDATKMEE